MRPDQQFLPVAGRRDVDAGPLEVGEELHDLRQIHAELSSDDLRSRGTATEAKRTEHRPMPWRQRGSIARRVQEGCRRLPDERANATILATALRRPRSAWGSLHGGLELPEPFVQHSVGDVAVAPANIGSVP